MLNLMMEAEPYGFFVGRYGEPIDIVVFAREINAKPTEVRKLIAELEEHGVFERDQWNRIYSRRKVREEAKAQDDKENGKRGGNPSLKGQDNHSDKATDNQGVNPKTNPHGIANTNASIPGLDSDSLRSSALAFGSWPDDVSKLRELAVVFLAAFGNCRDPIKAERHLPNYTQVLAQMRSRRGVTIAIAWKACEDAREANARPLFAGSIKSAMSFLPPSAMTSSAAPEKRLRVVTAADIEAMG